MSDMLKSTIVASTFAEKWQDLSEEFSKERSQDTEVANPYSTPTMDRSLSTSLRNPRNTSHHATRTNFLSVESSLTMSFVH